MRGRGRQAYEGNHLDALLTDLSGAQASAVWWPFFKGKYVD
jgi:hypothetical protein